MANQSIYMCWNMNEWKKERVFSWGRGKKGGEQMCTGTSLDDGGSPRTEFYVFSWVVHQPPTHFGPMVTHTNTGSDWFFKWKFQTGGCSKQAAIWSSNSTSQYVSRKLKAGIQTDIRTFVLTASLVIIAKWCKQPRCSSTDEQINKISSNHAMKYYSAFKEE